MMNVLRRLKLYKDGTATFEGFIRLLWAEHRAEDFLQDERSTLADAIDNAAAFNVTQFGDEGQVLVAIFVKEGADGDVHGVSKFDGQLTAAPLIYSLPVPWLKTLRDRMQKQHVPELRMYGIEILPCREESIPMRPDGADPTTRP